MLENFIGDLVDGTYTNGSDERMYANQWFDRCGFGMFPDNTFLRYLLANDCLNEVIRLWEDIKEVTRELEYAKEHSEEYEVNDIEGFRQIGKPLLMRLLMIIRNIPKIKK